jgi:hypothetical protein
MPAEENKAPMAECRPAPARERERLAPGETFTVERASADHVTGKVEVIQTAMEVQKVAAEHAGAYGQGMRYVIEMFAAGGRAS